MKNLSRLLSLLHCQRMMVCITTLKSLIYTDTILCQLMILLPTPSITQALLIGCDESASDTEFINEKCGRFTDKIDFVGLLSLAISSFRQVYDRLLHL